MSRKATDWAWDQLIRPASLKILLLSMADRADEYHQCYPSIARLTKDTSLDKKTVQSGIIKLIDRGVISDTGKKVGPTQRVRVLKLNIESFTANDPKNGNVPKSGILNDPKNGVLNDPKNGVLNDPENGIQNQSLEPANESLKDLVTTSSKSALDFSLWPDLPSYQVFQDWLAVRKQKKAKLTQTAVNRLAPHLIKAVAAGCSVDDVFALCASRCWIGFEFDWLVNAGLIAKQAVKGDWGNSVFDPEDPLI
jgi:hypothetical protein